MDWLIEWLPPFWRTALADPATWGFWDWVNNAGAVFAISLFLLTTFRFGRKLVARLFLAPLFEHALRIHLLFPVAMFRHLNKMMASAMEFGLHPERLTAAGFRTVARAFLTIVPGLYCAVALPPPYGGIIGFFLTAEGLLHLAGIWYVMRAFRHLPEYVEREFRMLKKARENLRLVFIGTNREQEFLKMDKEIEYMMNEIKQLSEVIHTKTVPGAETGADNEGTTTAKA